MYVLAATFLLTIVLRSANLHVLVFADRLRVNGGVDVSNLRTGTRVLRCILASSIAIRPTIGEAADHALIGSVRIGFRFPAVNVTVIDHCRTLFRDNWLILIITYYVRHD